jgi:DNA-binding IclR family transcriptional regulator
MKPRGTLIRNLLRLLHALETEDGLNGNDIVKRTRMEKRQVYRWLKAFEQEREAEQVDVYPTRWRRREKRKRWSMSTGKVRPSWANK